MATTVSSGAAGWQQMPALPEPNGGMTCYAVGEDIVVAGGTNWENDTKNWLAKRWRFDAKAKAWKPLPPLSAPLAYTAGGGLFTAGGSENGKSVASILQWRADALPHEVARLSQPVTLVGASFTDGRLFIIGGAADIADFSTVTAQCFEWRPGTKEPQRLPDYPAGLTALVAVAASKGRVFAFTGATWDAATKQVVNRSAAFAFDLATRSWKPITPYPFAARGVTAVALSEKQVFLAGGYKSAEEGFTDESFLYDIASDRYKPAARLPIRSMVHLVKTRDWLWLLGGEDRQRHRSAACWRIRLGGLLR